MKTDVTAKITVTLVVAGKTIELSESDARKVLAELQNIFRVEVKTIEKIIERDRNPFRTYPPQWTSPIPPAFHDKIYCSNSRVLGE